MIFCSFPDDINGNQTILLFGQDYAGTLKFTASGHLANTFVKVETEENNALRFKVNGLVECHAISGKPDLIITSDDFVGQFCYYNNYQGRFTGVGNSLVVEPMFNLSRYDSVVVYIDFYRTHYGSCAYDEVYCEGCMPKDLACDSSGNYCDTEANSLCSDIVPPNTGSAAIAGITVAVVMFSLCVFICCWCHRYRTPCFRRDSEQRSIAERAREIFTVQLTTRGVDSNRTGNDNEAYTEDGERIDPSLAQPPPEYSSLEHLDRVGITDKVEEDLPPSYDDAIENFEKYSVVDDTETAKY